MKSLTYRVLQFLADGHFHSGEALANELDVSRASVWHAVREMEQAGLEVYKVRGRGYRLSQALSLLDSKRVAHHLGHLAQCFQLEVAPSVDSTNTQLIERARDGAPSATVMVAEWQSKGRGRQGRAWHVGIGGALTFSLLWRFTQGTAFLGGLSLAIGVAIARALEKLGASGAGLKWPNDVVWSGRKLAGILIEMQGEALGPSTAVVGVGVNIRLSDTVRGRIDQEATDLESVCGRTLDRNEVLALLLAELHNVLEAFARSGFAPLRREWERRHAYRERLVTMVLPDRRTERGVARGVGEDGALLVETRSGLRRFHSGEVSLRGRQDRPAPGRVG